MMSYLTRPGKVLANNINDKKIPNTEARTALKKGSSDTKPTPKNNKILKYIDDHQIVYDGKEATKSEIEAATKRIDSYKNQMSYKDQYNAYFNKKSPKYYKADKPKTNGKYTMPKFNLDSFDWDIWLRENDPDYETLQEENKKAIQDGLIQENKLEEMMNAPPVLTEYFTENFQDPKSWFKAR